MNTHKRIDYREDAGHERAVTAVFFDVDGVVVDSVVHKSASLADLLVDDLGLDVAVDNLIGLNRRDKYDYLRKTTDVDISAEEFIRQYEATLDGLYARDVTLLDGFPALLRDLRTVGIPVGLVSAGRMAQVETVVERFDLEELLDTVVTADSIDGKSKPHPDLYERAAATLGIRVDRSIAVEDSEYGVLAATRAGAYCIGYAPPANPVQELGAANEVVEGPAELRQAIDVRVGIDGDV
ncbi:HAD family hydrolase [Halorussus salinisoli]|uniref:HAD family hydrolase n=1 Tax=Halorussus salinisoli TaxID=2558242 RepID=UPI00148571F8|nr:HAD-IA family hydrolase [Halorussus salinisoli]